MDFVEKIDWRKRLATSGMVAMVMSLFVSRTDVYAVQKKTRDGSIYQPVKEKLDDEVILRHLKGEVTIGVYPGRSSTRWICIDIDTRDEKEIKRVLARMREIGISPVVEDSGNKGYHVWIFSQQAIANWKARAIGKAVACGHEVFPKQDYIPDGSFGNLIKLPLGIHRETGRRCLFVGGNFQPVVDHLEYLKNITKHDGEKLWQRLPTKVQRDGEKNLPSGAVQGRHVDIEMIKPCVKALLKTGVGRGTRNCTAHIIASELRRVGIAQELCQEAMAAWNKKNRPLLHRMELQRIITSAYTKGYEYGCNPDGILRSMAKCVGKERCPFYRRLIEKKR